MMMRARLWNSETEDVTYKNLASREEAETFFKEEYFLYNAEITVRGNLLPIATKRARDTYLEWLDEE